MIKCIGDTHGESNDKLLKNRDCDYLIVLGDFGYYGKSMDKLATAWNKFHTQQTNPNCVLLFVDGNHEHFPALEKYPKKQCFGGTVSQIRPNIFWLRRGEVYTIEEQTFLVFGGAYSVDRAWRIEGKSWFPEEEYSNQEYANLAANLEKHDYKVDYILTHDAPRSIVERILYPVMQIETRTAQLFERLYAMVDFSHWYFGHHHIDWTYENFTCLYDKTITIKDETCHKE